MANPTQESQEIWSRRLFHFSIAVCVTALILTVGLVVVYQVQAGGRARLLKDSVQDASRSIVAKVTNHLKQIEPKVDELAAELNSGRLIGEPLQQRLKSVFEENHDDWDLLEVGVAYEPEHSPLGSGRDYAPHFGIKAGVEGAFDVQDSYIYRDSEWFRETKKDGAHWLEPYFGQATQRWTTGYAAPFFLADNNREFAGVVRINFDLEKIRDLVAEEVREGLVEDLVLRAGYMFLLSERQKIITHPIESYVGKEISELGKTDGTLRAISGMRMLDSGTMETAGDIVDSDTQESFWILTSRITSTDWRAVVVFNFREIQDPSQTFRIYRRASSATIVVFLCTACFVLLRGYRGTERSLWYCSIVCSFILLAGVVTTWTFAVTGQSRRVNNSVYIVDAPTAHAIALRHETRYRPEDHEVILVPTGVFVQSLTFTSANNVRLTGYLWQRKSIIPENPEGESPLGFVFPEAEEITSEKAYENDDVIGWYFETTLRQQFDYSRYPFDREDVWIRLWPHKMNPDVILIPDFKSYRERKIGGIPGVETNLVLEGWMIKNSYFSFRLNRYNVDFGQSQFQPERSLELYFNIGLRRNFVSPFVSDMIPVILIAFLAFAVLMCSTRSEQQLDLYGFSTSAVLGYCAALFFVLIVSHVHLRNSLASHGIIYMEYFYFVMYLVILGVSTNSLMFASPRNFAFVHYKDNIIAKQLYWPLLAGLLFVITLVVFY